MCRRLRNVGSDGGKLGRDPSAAQADIRYANEEKASACFGRDDRFFGGAQVGFGVEGSATLFWSGMTGFWWGGRGGLA